jgi:hypothetical protein
MPVIRLTIAALIIAAMAACGGGGSTLGSSGSGGKITGSGSNVTPLIVNVGPAANAVNTAYTSITLCSPGSITNCQTIDGIEVDTGSSGLRILASVLTISLPIQTDGSGNSLAECTQFVNAYSWGPIALADLTVSGESAHSLPMQVIGDPNFATVPAACSGTSGIQEDTVAAFGANGVLGVGPFAQDCGAGCAGSSTPGFYYACSSATQCVETKLALASQIQNPVARFPTDNNGVIIELPAVASGGAGSVTGSLVFGVDTQSNNTSGNATVLQLDPASGMLTVQLNGVINGSSFLDTGSNGLYFTDSSLTQCTDTPNLGFYCPSSTQSFTATLVAYTASGTGGNQKSATFNVANTDTLLANFPTEVAFSNLGGTFPTPNSVDLGLPFYYGHNIYEVLENASSSVAAGPYVAF